MKTVNKVNFYGTNSLSLSDKDNAQIFASANHAISWIENSGLINIIKHPLFDSGLFVNAFQSHEHENKETEYTIYSIFNFGSKAAIYIQDFENGDCISQKFMTKNELNKYDQAD
jgi:hypothetical protein